MLAEFDEVLQLLVCPGKLKPVTIQDNKVVWADDKDSSTPPSYSCIGQQPVLVDFENSILQEEDIFASRGQSVVHRSKGRTREAVKKIFLRPLATRSGHKRANQFAKMLKEFSSEPRLLIIGGGTKGLGTDVFYNDPDIKVVSFDVYISSLTHFVADAHNIPVKCQSFDGVWIQYVLEHVLEPDKVAREIYRVLRDRGLVCSETPFMQQVHEGRYDFTRYTHSGHRWLFREFQEIDSGVAMGPGCQLLWSIEHLAAGLFRSRKMGKLIKLLFFWTQFIELLIPERYKYDNASSTFFVGRKATSAIRPDDIVNYFRGT